eukprot:CAMPEP_0201596780 /NCGR_PEP_ID=MMETSP0190_2-20130828/193391_1 /ASSEMBLY_ACC=CAM_ASM_000263 /TAXON_ID=37353 /ORGANISM="Rosalina sp." /LENGTH=91 /DNA_ID=CAMNT_0048057325 /DNA_START=1839 /DNA_END=2111 /DNA_ORIENTATION=-
MNAVQEYSSRTLQFMDDRQMRYELNGKVPKSKPLKTRKRKDEKETSWDRTPKFDEQLHIALGCAMTKLGFESVEQICIKLNENGFDLNAKW